MFVKTVMLSFFHMDEKLEQGIFCHYFGNDFVHFLCDYANLNATPNGLVINNAVLEVPSAPFELSSFFLFWSEFLDQVFVGVVLTDMVLSGDDGPFVIKFHLSEAGPSLVKVAHFVVFG